MKVYLFIPGGEACGTCQGMQGVYESEPGRPHANCGCQITSFDRDGLHCHHEGEREIFNSAGGGIRVVQHFTVSCCCDAGESGEVTEGEVEIEIERDEDWGSIAGRVGAAIDGVEAECNGFDCPIA